MSSIEKQAAYPKEISEKRRPVAAPSALVDKDGKFVLGTFDGPLPLLNLTDAEKPCGVPMSKAVKKTRIKDWEAVEVAFEEGFFVCAVYSIGIIGFNIVMFFDNQTKQTTVWQNLTLPGKITTHDTLIGGSVKELTASKNSHIKIVNSFERGFAHAEGTLTDKKKGTVSFSFDLNSVSKPSVVSIPFGANKALYSHKEFFTVSGTLQLNGKTITSSDTTAGIIDDHKGYYPYRMHYYWVTGMGTAEDGTHIAVNLTQNQSVNPTDYNENLLWLDGTSSPLPPVSFTLNDGVWTVKDEFGYVDVKFNIESNFSMKVPALIINLSYLAPFGRLQGYVKDVNGKRYDVGGLIAMGEDKRFRV